MLQEIQFWTLTVNQDDSARLVCERDADDIVVEQEIPLTDFPLPELKFFLERGVLLLPSEH